MTDYENEVLRYLEQLDETMNSNNVYLNHLSNDSQEIKMTIGYYPSGETTLKERDIEYLEKQNTNLTLLAVILVTTLIFTFIMRCFK